MKKILAVFIFLSAPFLAPAQNLDSAAVSSAIDSLNELNRSLSEQQKFEEALVVIEAAKKQAAAAFGKEHPAYPKSVFNHGLTFDDMGDYEKAELLYLEAKDIRERVLGKEHPDYALSLNNLAVLYAITGNYDKAEPLYLETISIREKVLGKEHHEYAFGLINLANLYHYLGTYEKAEPLYLEAVSILEKALGKEHPHYASSLANLAFLYYKTSNYEKAEPLYLEANSIREKVLGKEHPYYAYSLVNLATLYRYTGNYEKAELLYLEAISILEKVLGREHPDYTSSLGNLALLYTDMSNHEKAKPLYLEAISIQEKTLGREHPHYALSLSNLASHYTVMGDHEKAGPLYLEAVNIQKKALGKEHPYYAESLINLAGHYTVMGDHEKAELLFLEAGPIQKNLLLKASRFASERELAAYTRQFNQSLSQIHSFRQIYADAQLNGLCFDQALFYKGFLLNASRQIRRLAAADTASAARFDLLTAYHRRLAAEYARPIAERQGVEELEEKANQTEKELTRLAAGFGQALRQVGWREVQAQLKAGEAAIEFVHYQFSRIKSATDSTMYAALVLKPGEEAPQFIPLFEEREIAAAAGAPEAGRADYANQLYASAGRGLKPRKAEEKTLLELNWQPLEKELQGIRTIYYAPSGVLHRLNLSAIPINEKEVLGDKYQLIRLGSTRQLAVPPPGTGAGGGALLFGGVRYEMDSTAISRANAGKRDKSTEPALNFQQTSRSLRGDAWQYLAWTEREVGEIAAILEKANIETAAQYGFAASEEAFRQIGQNQPSPRILHLATHGFFFPDPATAPERGRLAANSSPFGGGWEGASAFKTSNHPMIRSGLILAGGNHAWQGKDPIAGLEDGVLTAYEISQMDLSNTELVVLSACETGLGDIEGNEGVYGLQRAFKIAGARYLIMSLWQVPDRETMEFMVTFYQNWLEKKMGVPEAFRATQQAMREKYKNPYLWAAFVLVE